MKKFLWMKSMQNKKYIQMKSIRMECMQMKIIWVKSTRIEKNEWKVYE